MRLPTATLRISQPHPGLFAYFDGRLEGKRIVSPEPNWVDDGAYGLGIASFAVVEGRQAVVYDAHLSVAHGEVIRKHLEGLGVRDFRLFLSHHHIDHVCGNAAFSDCQIIAHKLTDEAMRRDKPALEAGTYDGPPAIKPLIMPTTLFEGRLALELGRRRLTLLHLDVHSLDGVGLMLEDERVLLAGDTLEDNITYVAEPARLEIHFRDLDRLTKLGIDRLLPNHGDADIIARGGYAPTLITATQRYMRRLLDQAARDPATDTTLHAFVAPEIDAGWITWYAPYEAVHRRNLAVVRGRGGRV
jgi:glyoxylase-like metal-dependent hydrolase (beta-lactamase superfamily II)